MSAPGVAFSRRSGHSSIVSITFDATRTLVQLSDTSTPYRELSDFLVGHDIELYPQELEAARHYVFMVDLPVLQLDNWFDWSSQILKRLKHSNVDTEIVSGMSQILQQPWLKMRLYDDVEPFFNHLSSSHLSFSVLTTIPEFKLEKAFKPIRHHLAHIIHGGNAGCVKGHPRMYELDLEWKQVRQEQNLFVGDDHVYDIELPSKMGQTTVHIERENGLIESEYSDYQISSMKELPSILDLLI